MGREKGTPRGWPWRPPGAPRIASALLRSHPPPFWPARGARQGEIKAVTAFFRGCEINSPTPQIATPALQCHFDNPFSYGMCPLRRLILLPVVGCLSCRVGHSPSEERPRGSDPAGGVTRWSRSPKSVSCRPRCSLVARTSSREPCREDHKE